MGPKPSHKLLSESTIARETEDAIKLSSCQIWIEEGASIPSKDVKRMRMEFHYAPYRSIQMKLQDMAIEKIKEPITCCIVYIRSFTNSGHDFAYCVPDRTNLTKFYGGTYGARDYQGPIFAALVVLAGAILERVGPINWRNYTRVPKYAERVNGVRWRYLFATARRAWSTMSFDASDLPVLEAMVADVPVQQQKPEPAARLPDAISDSNYPPEAQRIAIHQNVELLKKKPDHHDRIFEYLEIELTGRSNRQGTDELTKKQYCLVERLRDNADDFDTLYIDDDENGNPIRRADFSKEEEAHLLSERDVIIRQIQEQLALPITVRDESEDLDLPSLGPPDRPYTARDTKDSSRSDNDLFAEPMDVTKLEADLIQRLSDFTGASRHQCEGYLFTADSDLELALSYFQEDQARSRPSIVRNTNTPGPKERVDAVATFKALTNTDSAVASNYLNSAGWDVGKAVSTFFDDAEDPGADSKSAHESLNTVFPRSGPKIDDKSLKQIPPYMSDTTIKPAGEGVVLSASLRASIHRRIAELDAEITKIDKRIGDMDEDGLDVIMRDANGSERDSNEDSGLYTGPRGKLRIVNEDPSLAVTHRKGISHAGLPLVLDEAGNVISYKRPTGTPYQQYLAMRLRLQVQYYGHEVVPSDDDPHRGVPTREWCSAPLVQEEVSDSSSSDETIVLPKDTDPSASIEPADKTAQAQGRKAALKEMGELMDMIVDSQATKVTKSTVEADMADALTQLKNQRASNWAEQARETIQHVTWKDLTISNDDEIDSVLGDDDEVDSVFGSADDYDEDTTSTNDVDQEKCAPIKPALRDISQPRKLSMKVRFNLSNEEGELPITWEEHAEDPEEKTLSRGRSVLRGTRRSARLREKALATAAAIENEKEKTGTCEGQTSDSVGEQAGEEKQTQESCPEGDSAKPEDGKEKTEAQEEDAGARKKRDLFNSKQEDAWDGLDSDEGELELEAQSESDIDAEGEEEEVPGQRAGQAEMQQEKDKRPTRVDEKMED